MEGASFGHMQWAHSEVPVANGCHTATPAQYGHYSFGGMTAAHHGEACLDSVGGTYDDVQRKRRREAGDVGGGDLSHSSFQGRSEGPSPAINAAFGGHWTPNTEMISGTASCQNSRNSRRFVKVCAGAGVYVTDKFEPAGRDTTVYGASVGERLVNIKQYDQITFDAGTFCTDERRRPEGHFIHLWRYDTAARKLFVAQSFAFTDAAAYKQVRSAVEGM